MTSDRVLPLEGVHNFRDRGGYSVSGGGRLRRGMLWRSGQHHGATEADLKQIAAVELTQVFDLRTSKERVSYPCRRPAGFGAEIFLSADPSGTGAPHVAAAMLETMRTPQAMRERMVRIYHKIAFRPELQGAIRRYLAGLAEGAGPSLVNCLAGKDRTGMTVLMLHLATGVHRDDAVADYLLTNTAGDVEARIEAGANAIRDIIGPVDDAVMRVLMGVEAEYLDAALTAIIARHGSTDAYLNDAVGADDALRELLRAALVEG